MPKQISVGLVPDGITTGSYPSQQAKPLSVGLAPVGSNVFRRKVSWIPPGQAQTGSTEIGFFW